MLNRKKSFLFFLVVTGLIMSGRCQAFTAYLEMSNGSHAVALLGMVHKSDVEQLHEQQAIDFVNFIAAMNNQEVQERMKPKESNCYYEIDSAAVSDIRANLSNQNKVKVFGDISYTEGPRGDFNNRILARSLFDHPGTRTCKLVPADLRTYKDERLAWTFSHFEQAINEGSQEIYKQYLDQNDKLKRLDPDMVNLYHHSGQMTVKEYLDLIQSRIVYLNALRDRYQVASAEFNVFNVILEKVTEFKNHIDGVLRNLDSGLYLNQAFVYLLEQRSEKSKKLELLKELEEQIVFGVASHFADAVFLEKLLLDRDSQKEVTVMVIGMAHMKKLSQYLLSLGYESTHMTQSRYRHLPNGGVGWDLCGLTTLLYQRLKELHGVPSETILPSTTGRQSASTSESSANATPPARICSFCGSVETLKAPLKRCIRCKNAYYCNCTCQKSDWKKHKGTCIEAAAAGKET